MIRKVFKKNSSNPKIDAIMKKYKIPSELLSVNRKMVARAVLVGMFIAMIPMPMQMLAVILVAPFFRFNVPIGVSLVWITNPFTMPVIYYVEYITGNFLLMRDGVCEVEMTMQWFTDNIGNIFIPLYVGTFFFSTIGASLGYWTVNHFWHGSVHRDRKLHRKHR